MKRKYSDWVGLIFVEIYLAAIVAACVWGFFYQTVPQSSNLSFLEIGLKTVFLGTALFVSWLFFLLPQHWFKN